MTRMSDDKAQDAVNTATDAVRGAANKTADTVSGVAKKSSDSAAEGVESATAAVNEALDAAQQKVSTGLRQATEIAADVNDRTTGAVKKYPVRTALVVVFGAALAGFIVGVVTSRRS